ncbi:MAG: type II secretion system F family protein [Myxococcota bacterium]|jgi:tight adherence protein C
MTTLVLIVLALAMGFAVALLAVGIHNVFLSRVVEAARAESVEGDDGRVAKGLRAIIYRRMGRLNKGLVGQDYRSWISRRIISAGEPRGLTTDDLITTQELSTAAFFVIGTLFTLALKLSFVWVVIFTATGAAYPMIWLNDKVNKRKMAITRALPYNLDLLTLAVEAGLDFQAATAKVVEKGKQGPLIDELRFMMAQLKLGKTREEGLKLMAVRVDMPSVSAFVNALIQADRMGASLGKVLRIQATQLRQDRSARAEKLANEAPVKMLFPLIFFIFPTVFMVLFGPIIYQFMFGEVF